ncbi:hypothetical protein TFLX_00141 [Thermoflexales bacterium]|nr:hypothetical protein TFLX_00141 [Thermoflexales bacterium]
MKADVLGTPLVDTSAAHQPFIRKAGALYGVVVALAFVLFFWLPDALILREAHYSGWWMKLALGPLIVIPVSALVGWLAASMHWAGVSLLIWIGGGGLLAWLGGHIHFDGISWLMRFTDIYPHERVMYPFARAAIGYTGISILAGAGAGLFIGLIGLIALERAWDASTPRHGFSVKSLALLGVCLPVLLGLGAAADYQINASTRDALTAVHQLIETVRDPNADLARAKVSPMARHRDKMSANYTLHWNTNDEDLARYSIDVQFDTGLLLRCPVLFDNAFLCSELSLKLEEWMTQLLTVEGWTCANCGLEIDAAVRQWLKATESTRGELESINLLKHHGGWLYMRATFAGDRKIDCRFNGDQPVQVDLCVEVE